MNYNKIWRERSEISIKIWLPTFFEKLDRLDQIQKILMTWRQKFSGNHDSLPPYDGDTCRVKFSLIN